MYTATDLCNRLNGVGIRPSTYWAHDGEVDSWKEGNSLVELLMTLPQENLAKIIDMNYTGLPATYADIEQEWGRRGYLKFKPYVTNFKHETPNVTIKYNRHLHMFRGYHFQVSDTPNGAGSNETGSFRTDFLLHHNYCDADLWSNSILANMLCYAAVIDTAFVYDNFRDWFNSNDEERDKFVRDSFNYYGMEMKYTWDAMKSYISYGDEWESATRQIYKVYHKDSLICEFAFGTETIQVRTSVDGKVQVLTLRVPKACEGIPELDSWDSDDLEEFTDRLTFTRIGSNENVRVDIYMLLIMAMALSGFRLNWMVCYECYRHDKLKGTNSPYVEIEDMNGLINYAPDAF